jgi:hypothetical protein
MVKKYADADDSDFSEPRTTAMSSLVIENALVFNKSRTVMDDQEPQVKPFIPLVTSKPLSAGESVTKAEKVAKLKAFRQLRKDTAAVEYCKDLQQIQATL